MSPGRILIAGVGNVLRGDDGFGIQAARRLQELAGLPRGVRVVETGIGGISLVQELMDDWDALVVLDALRSGDQAGTLQLRRLEVQDLRKSPAAERQSFLADIHFANPTRALMLAKALDRLPALVYLLGCSVSSTEEFGTSLSEPVSQATDQAAILLRDWLQGKLKLQEGVTA